MAIRKRVPLVVTIVLLGLCISLTYWAPKTSVRATWTYPSGFDAHGGYVDRWMWVIGGGAGISPITDLAIGAVDAVQYHIPADFVTELEADPNIEVHFEPNLGFRNLVLHCQKFPTNITGYRRALAFALDKNLVCEEAEGDLAEPMDGAIPITLSRWTYEHQITEHFYAKDIESANASLEAAGFRDLDGDGWREYDNNNNSIWDEGIDINDGGPTYNPALPGCHIQLIGTADYEPVLTTFDIMEAGMRECGLRGSIELYDFETMLDYVGFGDFHLACFSWDFEAPGDPVRLYDLFYSESLWNLVTYRYNNSEFDYQITSMMVAPTYEEAKQWAWNGSKILLEDMPIITCYNSINTHAYRTDRWTGYVKMPAMGVMGYNPWTYTSVRLRETAGGPFGCYPTTYRCSFEGDVVTSNVLISGKTYEQIVFGMIYDSLWELDPFTWEPSPLIARNWTIEETSAFGDIQDGQKFTFHLFDNITWHDGAPLTSADVEFSLETLWPNSTVSSRRVENIYRIETPDDFTVIIYSNVSGIFEFTEATSLFILPKHIWEPQRRPDGDFISWVPETPADFTGSGPYNWTERIPGEYIVLDRNPDWIFAMDQPARPLCALNPIPLGLIGFSIAVIVIIVGAGVYYFRTRRR